MMWLTADRGWHSRRVSRRMARRSCGGMCSSVLGVGARATLPLGRRLSRASAGARERNPDARPRARADPRAPGGRGAGNPDRAVRRLPLQMANGAVDEARVDPAGQVHHRLVVDAQGPEDEVSVEVPAGSELEEPGGVERAEVLAEGADVVLVRGARLAGGGVLPRVAPRHVALEHLVGGLLHGQVLEHPERERLQSPVPHRIAEAAWQRCLESNVAVLHGWWTPPSTLSRGKLGIPRLLASLDLASEFV